MIACVDVDYRADHAIAACIVFDSWTSAASAHEYVARIADVAEYVPGEFYRRELPCLLQVLDQVPQPLEAVIVDGYVWLSSTAAPGLGFHLYEAFRPATPIIGVAKTAYRGSDFAVPVLRGTSTRPLWVTAVGIDAHLAASSVQSMHGSYRMPTHLKRVDQRCRA
jgi:deoxyribonuclease V